MINLRTLSFLLILVWSSFQWGCAIKVGNPHDNGNDNEPVKSRATRSELQLLVLPRGDLTFEQASLKAIGIQLVPLSPTDRIQTIAISKTILLSPDTVGKISGLATTNIAYTGTYRSVRILFDSSDVGRMSSEGIELPIVIEEGLEYLEVKQKMTITEGRQVSLTIPFDVDVLFKPEIETNGNVTSWVMGGSVSEAEVEETEIIDNG